MLQKLQGGRVSSIALIFFAVEALKKSEKISFWLKQTENMCPLFAFEKNLVLLAYTLAMVHVFVAGEWRCEQKDWWNFNSTVLLELTGWTIERWTKK